MCLLGYDHKIPHNFSFTLRNTLYKGKQPSSMVDYSITVMLSKWGG